MVMEARVGTHLTTCRVHHMESQVELQSTEPQALLPTLVVQPMAQHTVVVTRGSATAQVVEVSRSIPPTPQLAWEPTRVHPTHQTPQATIRA